MYKQLSRARMRDQVRRQLGQIPPIDDGSGAEGAQPGRWPWPSNAALNVAIDRAVGDFDLECEISGDPVARQVPVAAQSANGPYQAPLSTLGPYGAVMDVRSVAWQPSGGQPRPLTAAFRDSLDRDGAAYQNAAPGVPTTYWIEGGVLLVSPAPAAAGVLWLQLSETLWTTAATVDAEVPEAIPAPYFPDLIDRVTLYVCEETPEDEVVQTVYKIVAVRHERKMPKVVAFFKRRNKAAQASLVPKTLRVGIYASRP